MVEVRAHRVASDLRVSVKARQHEVIADAGTEDGGTDAGPTPHELLAASLASCTSITVQMYANRKGWPLNGCDVTVRHQSADKSDVNGTSVFDVTVSFDGALTHEQRARLLEIANRCPVHRELTRPIQVRVVAI